MGGNSGAPARPPAERDDATHGSYGMVTQEERNEARSTANAALMGLGVGLVWIAIVGFVAYSMV
jgi:hypothetical protein